MGYDPFSPVFLAKINVICLPASRISKKKFRECVNALRARASVPIKNGSSNDGHGGNSNARGWVLLNISDSHSPDSISRMYPFEAGREPQIVIGISLGDDDVHTTMAALNQHTSSYQHAVTRTIVRCGKASLPNVDGCVSIDDISDDVAVSAAISEVVAIFQRALPGFLERVRSEIANLPRTGTSSRRLSTSSNASNRIDNGSSRESRTHDQTAQGHDVASQERIAFGILHLQAGQWSNALRLLAEGTVGTRTSGDQMWQARGLEGLTICMILLVWAHMDFTIPQVCFPSNEKHNQINYSASMSTIIAANRANSISLFGNTSTSSTDAFIELLPHLLSSILGLYEQAVNNIESSTPIAVLFEAKTRWLSLLVILSTNGSALTHECVQAIVEGRQQRTKTKLPAKASGPILVLQKSVLSRLLVDAALEAQIKLGVTQSAPLQLALAAALSMLGIERKQGFHLKQFLQRLIPALFEARKRGAAELGIHPSANLPHFDDHSGEGMLGARKGVGRLLQFIADAYGLPTTHLSIAGAITNPEQQLKESLEFWYAVHAAGDIFMKLEVLGLCIEISDAIPDPRSSLFFSSYLLQASKRMVTVTPQQDEATPLIASKDLPRILQNMRSAVIAAENMGLQECRSQFWDKFLVRDITLLEESISNRLMTHTAHDLTIAVKADSEEKKDPFIFNPFAKPKLRKGELIVTNGDLVYFTVVLQNPLEAEIEVEDISLLTEGCEFAATSHSIVLGPSCSQSFALSGMPKQSGQLKVIGCRATIRGCYQEDFLILPDIWKPPRPVKQRSQHTGFTSHPLITLPKPKRLSLKVIDHLPLLAVAGTSLLQPSLMLLDGERTRVQISLRNVTTIDIDFITLTFDDSVKQQLEEALANKDLNPADTYEVQLQVIHRPAVKWLNQQSDLKIKAGQSHNFDIEILGRPGLTYVNVLVDYTFLGKSRTEVTETFYTRQLFYSIATTVNGAVDISRCMIMPALDDTAWITKANPRSPESEILPAASNVDGGNRCMLLLDMRNIWPHPLEVEFRASESVDTQSSNDLEKQVYTVSERLQPGQVARVVLLVPRIYIADARAIIPNLDTRKQFVVSTSKLTVEAEAANREVFWYRERLLSCLKAVWKEEFGSKSGEVDLRKGLRLNSRMIEALRIDTVDISFKLKPDPEANSIKDDDDNDDTVIAFGTSHYSLARNKFAVLSTEVYNRGDTELKLLLRLQPSLRNQAHSTALELSKRFIWSGTLHKAIHPPLQPGETREIDLGIIVLAAGEYEVNAMAEEIQRPSSNTNGNASKLGADTERRIWYARQPCQIDVPGQQ